VTSPLKVTALSDTPEPVRAAHEAAWEALDAARPGRVRIVLAGSLTGPAGLASPRDEDLVALAEVADDLRGASVDLVLQSPGSSFEVAEEVLRSLRNRVGHLAVLVPRRVRGGLSLLACLADELLLGPDGLVHAPLPSLPYQGRVQPADLAILDDSRDVVGAARAKAALTHVRRLLREGLERVHELPSIAADEVAQRLTSTPTLGLPGRGLDSRDLRALGLPMAVPSPAQLEALRLADRALQACLPPGGHWVLGPAGGRLRAASDAPQGISVAPGTGGKPPSPPESPVLPEVASVAVFEVRCECGTVSKIQANLETAAPLQDGHWAFPPDGVFLCPECMDRKDLRPLRRQLEEKTHRKVVT
jgi:hypothetical protein